LTDSRKTGSELRRVQEQLLIMDRAMNATSAALCIVSMEGRIEYANSAFAAMWGVDDPESLKGSRLNELPLPPSYLSSLADIKKLTEVRQESWFQIGNKPRFYLEANAVLLDSGNRPEQWALCSLMDRTEKKTTEEQLMIRLRYEEGLARCSSALLMRGPEALGRALRAVRETIGSDRVFLFENFADETDGLCARMTLEACAEAAPSGDEIPQMRHLPYDSGFSRWRKELADKRMISGPISGFPERERRVFTLQGISWIAALPIWIEDDWYGFLGIAEKEEDRSLTDEDFRFLSMAVQMIAIYLTRIRIGSQLRESDRRLELAMRGANDGIWDQPDVNRDEEWWSPRFYELLGYEPGEIRASSQQFVEMLQPEDRERVVAVERDHLRGGLVCYDVEHRLRTKDGSYRWFRTRGQGTRDERREVSRLSGTMVDIHDRKMAEEALLISRQQFESLLQNLGEGVAVMDKDKTFVFSNPTAESIFGVPAGGLVGRNLREFLDHQGLAVIEAQSRLRKRGKQSTYELEIRPPSGSRCQLEITGRPNASPDARFSGTLAIFRDITGQKEAEAELERVRDQLAWLNRELEEALLKAKQKAEEADAANRAKSDFLANMSHEIRTPMNGIMGMVGLLLDTKLDSEQVDFVETIQGSADVLLSIINDILDFSKIEAGKLYLEILDFDLRSTLEDMNDLLAIRPQQKGLEYVCLVEPEVPSNLLGDPGRLRQILTNLIGNAAKFTETGEIVVRAQLAGQTPEKVQLRFSVTDTGIGIPQDKLARLFDPFTQADASTTRRFGGTGLGLSICARLVELMDGEIGVESTEGRGSTFWFTTVFAVRPAEAVRVQLPMVDIRDKRILIVDDNDTNRYVLRKQLLAWGCGCEEASEGQQALAMLKEAAEAGKPFDIAILDMRMPKMDGETLGRKIKSDGTIGRVKLVMMSSVGLRGDGARVKEIGFSAYLSKPIKQSQLYDCLATVAGEGEPVEGKKRTLVTRHTLSEQRRGSLRILLAEDNPTNQKVALGLLNKMGYRADAVADGQEVLTALALAPYDLVLMDVQMPEIDGLEAASRIRASDPAVLDPKIPIIAMTAHALAEDREMCLKAGMDDYVSKPVDAQKLVEAIERVVGNAPAAARHRSQPRLPATPIEIFDQSVLAELFGEDKKMIRSILEGFVEDLPPQLADMAGCLKQDDLGSLTRLGHTLKGAAVTVGATQLRDIAADIETACSAQDLDKARILFSRLQAAWAALSELLKGTM
jgi:two-component system sensor histidine kinase/response regulator